MADPAAPLEEIRARAASADRVLKFGGSFAEAAARSQADVPRLIAALDAVLELHQPKPLYGLAFTADGKPLCDHDPDSDPDAHFEGDDGLWYCRDKVAGQSCRTCAEEDAADLWAEWPCPTYERITAALTGKEAGDGLEARP